MSNCYLLYQKYEGCELIFDKKVFPNLDIIHAFPEMLAQPCNWHEFYPAMSTVGNALLVLTCF